MMQISGAKPTPLPPGGTAPHEPGRPELWDDTNLVRFHYEITTPSTEPGKPAKVTRQFYDFDGGAAVHNGDQIQPGTLKDLSYPGSQNYISPYDPDGGYGAVGTSFGDAVKSANKTAKFATDMNGRALDAAQAVLQGSGGQYYVTTLRAGGGVALLNPPATDESKRGLAISGVDALHPDVKAVVDRDEWINFSGQAVEVDLAN